MNSMVVWVVTLCSPEKDQCFWWCILLLYSAGGSRCSSETQGCLQTTLHFNPADCTFQFFTNQNLSMCTSRAVLGVLVAVEHNSLYSGVLLLLGQHNPGIDTMHLHVLHVSACCSYYQVHRAFTVTLPSAIPPYTRRVYTLGVLCVQVCLCNVFML
jgi:hypothetical protein